MKKYFLGHGIQFIFLLSMLGLMYIGGAQFLIISLIFILIGGFAEFIFMKKFHSSRKIRGRLNLNEKIKKGFFWVHTNVGDIKKYGTNIYSFDKIGILPLIVAYLIMLIYVLIALILFRVYGYYGLGIYLIPAITNIYSFWMNNYLILN